MAAEARQTAVIRCTVAKRARLEACTVLEESPAGAGVGDRALRLSKEMRFRGRGTVGGTVTIPITFERLEGEPSGR